MTTKWVRLIWCIIVGVHSPFQKSWNLLLYGWYRLKNKIHTSGTSVKEKKHKDLFRSSKEWELNKKDRMPLGNEFWQLSEPPEQKEEEKNSISHASLYPEMAKTVISILNYFKGE